MFLLKFKSSAPHIIIKINFNKKLKNLFLLKKSEGKYNKMHLPLDINEVRFVRKTIHLDDGIGRIHQGFHTVGELRFTYGLSDEDILELTD